MTSSLHFRPGEDLLQPRPAALDALKVPMARFGARKRPKIQAAPEEDGAVGPLLEDPAPTPGARLFDPAWERDEAAVEESVQATVSFDPGDSGAPRLVTLELHAVSPDGEKRRVDGKGDVPVKGGKAVHVFTLFPFRFQTAEGEEVQAPTYVFTASHPHAAPVESPPLRISGGPSVEDDEEVVLYSPSRQDYLLLSTPEAVDALRVAARLPEDLRRRSQAAWTLPDPARRMETLEAIGQEARQVFGGDSTGEARKGVEELLLVTTNPRHGALKAWTYIPQDFEGRLKPGEKAGWNRARPKDVQEKLDKVLKRGAAKNRKAPLLDMKLKAKLFKSDPRSGQAWQWATPGGEGAGKQPAAEAERFDFGAEAAVARYMAGYDGGLDFDLKKKTLKFGVAGEASASVLEGRLTGTLHLPYPKGLNIVPLVELVKFGDIYRTDPNRVCLLRLALEGTLSTFVGAKVEAALAFPSLCFEGQSQGKQKAELGGSLSAFAGGQARAGVNLEAQWAEAHTKPFGGLAAFGYEGGASFGVGGELAMKVDYSEGRFHFQLSAAVT